MNLLKKYLADRGVLKIILNLWTIITLVLFCLDFFSGNKFDTAASMIGWIYLAILGIYTSEKEYDRWKTKFTSRFLGETFLGLWTAMMVVFVIAAPLSDGAFKVPAEFAVVYTSVVGIFALTQHSKNLRSQQENNKAY